MRRRDGDGCPVASALAMIGDKWTLLVVRDLAGGARRTTELLAALRPISSRTLLGRLREMEQDQFIERRSYGGSPPHVEYELTKRGQQLLPLLDALRYVGETLARADCQDRRQRTGVYCDACPRAAQSQTLIQKEQNSIVLL